MISAPLRIMIVAALCVLSLIALVVRESMARAAGTEVQMSMEAVDPRALLSGNYVTVSLREALPAGALCPTNAAGLNNEWVALKPDGAIAHAIGGASTREDALRQAPLAAHGSLSCNDASPGFFGIGATHATMVADLGIQRFYVGQAEARRIDDLLRHADRNAPSPVNAIVSIGQDGRARLKGLSVKGERLELNWL